MVMKHAKVKNTKKKTVLGIGIAVCLTMCLIFVIGTIANATNRMADSDTFGIGKDRYSINGKVGIISSAEYQNAEDFEASQTSLASFSTRDISTPLSFISYRIEERNKIIEAQKKAAELAEINNLKNKQNNFIRQHGFAEGLEPLDYDCGKEAFIATWANKINRYLAGSPLAGKGECFAAAAWYSGEDPRWSPAISNTESTKGAHCFASHNA